MKGAAAIRVAHINDRLSAGIDQLTGNWRFVITSRSNDRYDRENSDDQEDECTANQQGAALRGTPARRHCRAGRPRMESLGCSAVNISEDGSRLLRTFDGWPGSDRRTTLPAEAGGGQQVCATEATSCRSSFQFDLRPGIRG